MPVPERQGDDPGDDGRDVVEAIWEEFALGRRRALRVLHGRVRLRVEQVRALPDLHAS